MTLISDLTHFLEPNGDVAKLPDEAQKLFEFLSAIVGEVSHDIEEPIIETELNCRKYSDPSYCSGQIDAWYNDDCFIEWHCSDCNDNGVISNWRNSHWDNSVQKFH